MIRHLFPEEDALDDPDDDDETDPSLPGDLWFRRELRAAMMRRVSGRTPEGVVYSRAFVPSPA
jgi:hypothetical protein